MDFASDDTTPKETFLQLFITTTPPSPSRAPPLMSTLINHHHQTAIQQPQSHQLVPILATLAIEARPTPLHHQKEGQSP